jgi:hypothetical protein
MAATRAAPWERRRLACLVRTRGPRPQAAPVPIVRASSVRRCVQNASKTVFHVRRCVQNASKTVFRVCWCVQNASKTVSLAFLRVPDGLAAIFHA